MLYCTDADSLWVPGGCVRDRRRCWALVPRVQSPFGSAPGTGGLPHAVSPFLSPVSSPVKQSSLSSILVQNLATFQELRGSVFLYLFVFSATESEASCRFPEV